MRVRVVASAAAALLALSGCGEDASPAQSEGEEAAVLQVERVGEFIYDEGTHGYFVVEDSSGAIVVEEEFDDAEVAEGMRFETSLDPGAYEVRSYMRPCVADCPPAGSLDPPTAECSGQASASAGEEVEVVVEHDAEADSCSVRVLD